jgi:putative transposase
MTLGGREHANRYDVVGYARFLTFSCHDRRPLFSDDTSRHRFAYDLEATRRSHSVRLLAWVLMPEHAHLCVLPTTPGEVREFLKHLKGAVARHVLAAWRETNDPRLQSCLQSDGGCAFWLPGGGYDRLVRNQDELREKIEYIHNNPVKRGLVDHATEWNWSSARWYAGDRAGPVTIDPLSP